MLAALLCVLAHLASHAVAGPAPRCPESLLDRLSSPAKLRDSFRRGAGELLTDKFGSPKRTNSNRTRLKKFVDHSHTYEQMYQRYLGGFVRERCMRLSADPAPKVRLLEIGLGCSMESVGGKPGGGINIWRALFPAPFVLEIYSFEFGAACAQQWERDRAA